MKKVLLAAALIGGTFFSANAVELNEDFPGCVTNRELVSVTTVKNEITGNTTTEYHYANVTRCTSMTVTGVAVKVIR